MGHDAFRPPEIREYPDGLNHQAPTFPARFPRARSTFPAFHSRKRRPHGAPRLRRSSEPEVMAMHAKDVLGKSGEQAAAEYLESCGLRILDRNWRCAAGEIDIVAVERYALVVVEVKARTGMRYGSPLEAVSRAKRARLRRLAVQWLNAHGVRFDQVRIDVVGLVYDGTGGFTVEHIRGGGVGVPLARTHSVALMGVTGHVIEVEADIANGLVGMILVGLPDTALREARDRIRAAIVNSGEDWPQRKITVGLSPASLPKRGSWFDLAIAVGVLAAAGKVPRAAVDGVMFFGELGLDGQLRPVRGVLPAVAAAVEAGFGKVMVAQANASEAILVPGVHVIAATSLTAAADWLRGTPGRDCGPAAAEFEGGQELPDGRVRGAQGALSGGVSGGRAGRVAASGAAMAPDLAELLGQSMARRAAEVCAAGGHHLSLLGPPGAGKTMLAERIPTILPRLDTAAALEVTAIHSVAGTLPPQVPLLTDPPFLAPHHTATKAAIVGGGSGIIIPGSASLAHRGVLFLDEARHTRLAL